MKTNTRIFFSQVIITSVIVNLLFISYCFYDQTSIRPQSVQVVEPVQNALGNDTNEVKRAPKFWFPCSINYSTYSLEFIEKVLVRLGLEKIDVKLEEGQLMEDDWDLVWSLYYPLKIPINFNNVKPQQKINHFPGNYVLVSKSHLSTMLPSKYIPRGFRNLKEFRAFASKHPEKRFVQKKKDNGGVEFKTFKDMQINGLKFHGNFAQEFIDEPLLLEGHKFDFAIYVVITSLNPLRLYYYSMNVLLRFCPLPYSPNNFTNSNTYAITTPNNIPGAIFGPIAKYFSKGYTYKEALNSNFRHMGIDVDKVWSDVEDCIRSVVLDREQLIIKGMEKAFENVSMHSFFEMYRFDFLFDKHVNLKLIEINMHPNVWAATYPKLHNKPMYENMLFHMFNMLGIGTYWPKTDLGYKDDVKEMEATVQSLTINVDICSNEPCQSSCGPKTCKLCWHCMNDSQQFDILSAYREHVNRGRMKRVFPPDQKTIDALGPDYIISLSPANKLLTKWFIEMCKKDTSFCV